MAKEEKPAKDESPAAAEPAKPSLLASLLSPTMIAVVLNTLVGIGALGVIYYIKMLYKRPVITETKERERLKKEHSRRKVAQNIGLVTFPEVTINIAPMPSRPKPADGSAQQIQGKLHYTTIGFALELEDIDRKDIIEELRPVIMDKLLSMVGRKTFQELSTVQGRYLLRTQILEMANQLVSKRSGGSPEYQGLVGEVYFTHFIVQ